MGGGAGRSYGAKEKPTGFGPWALGTTIRQAVIMWFWGGRLVGKGSCPLLDDVDFSAVAAFAVDGLTAFFGFHAGAEADFSDAFSVGDFVGVMHVDSVLRMAEGGRRWGAAGRLI